LFSWLLPSVSFLGAFHERDAGGAGDVGGKASKLTANFRNLPVQTIFDSGDTVPP
jgi:hypothetical protein